MILVHQVGLKRVEVALADPVHRELREIVLLLPRSHRTDHPSRIHFPRRSANLCRRHFFTYEDPGHAQYRDTSAVSSLLFYLANGYLHGRRESQSVRVA